MNDPVDGRVLELMQRLDSVLDGESAAAHLVACGEAAVSPLRRFVLDSPPRVVPHPRVWAVRALAGLGAKDILIEYLRRDPPPCDPVAKLAEETVQREAALALAAGWQTEDVFEVLLRIAVRHHLPGLVEALGRFERRDAVPFLIDVLEDDFCRPWAEAALERVATRDRDLLIDGAVRQADDVRDGGPGVRRLRALLELLRAVPLTANEGHVIARLVDCADVDVTVDAAAIAFAAAPPEDVAHARRRLLAIAASVPWHLHQEVRRLLNTTDR